VSGTEAFIVAGSENGELLFWDVTSKEILQRVDGHDGVVSWVDTAPGPTGMIVSGGADGKVSIWVDSSITGEPIEPSEQPVDHDEAGHVEINPVEGLSNLKVEDVNGQDIYEHQGEEDDDVDMVTVDFEDEDAMIP
jgi:COMPASS component SWD3